MNDQTTPEDEDDGQPPDGLVVLHYPPDPEDHTPPYGIGPFPPDEELIDKIIEGFTCGCRLVVIGVAFPKHIKMVVALDSTDLLAALMAAKEEEAEHARPN